MNADWNHLVPHGIPGKREPSPRTLRFPIELAREVSELAEERGTDFTTTALGLIKMAMNEVKAASSPVPNKKRPAPKLKRAS